MGQYAHVSTNLSLYSISVRPHAENNNLPPRSGRSLNIMPHAVFGSLPPLLYGHRLWPMWTPHRTCWPWNMQY